jgi:hypothetical protein
MVRRENVLELVRNGASYPQAAERLGIPAGLAYLIGTGVATDSSDGLSPEDLEREGLLTGPQSLSCPVASEPAPDRVAHVRAFLKGRARADEQMQAAAREREGQQRESRP